MNPLDQTIFSPAKYDGKTFGNCVQTCVASILEISIDNVPHCCHLSQLARSKELAALGYGMIKTGIGEVFDGYHLICGIGPREIIGADGVTKFPIHHAKALGLGKSFGGSLNFAQEYLDEDGLENLPLFPLSLDCDPDRSRCVRDSRAPDHRHVDGVVRPDPDFWSASVF